MPKNRKVSLAPLSLEEALKALGETPPPPESPVKAEKQAAKKQRHTKK